MMFPTLDVTTNQGTGVPPFFGGITGYWQVENVNITESEPKFRQGTWVANDLTIFCVASNQFLADNAVGADALRHEPHGRSRRLVRRVRLPAG
jgi:HK97 family phage major capsid protein